MASTDGDALKDYRTLGKTGLKVSPAAPVSSSRACCAVQRAPTGEATRVPAQRAWRALPALIVAGLVPKCPLCLLGILTLIGATGIREQLLAPLSARLLFWLTVALAVSATAWLLQRRGASGGLVGGIAAALVLCGKRVYPSSLLIACGIALLAGYLLFGQEPTKAPTKGRS